LCHLPPDGPDAAAVCARCREHDVFLREAGTISARLGSHTLRIAAKDPAGTRRVIHALVHALDY